MTVSEDVTLAPTGSADVANQPAASMIRINFCLSRCLPYPCLRSAYSYTLTVEAVGYFETSVYMFETTWRDIPEIKHSLYRCFRKAVVLEASINTQTNM